MDANTMASIGSGVVAVVALVRTFGREQSSDQDQRIREVIKLEIGDELAVLNERVMRIMRKMGINGDD